MTTSWPAARRAVVLVLIVAVPVVFDTSVRPAFALPKFTVLVLGAVVLLALAMVSSFPYVKLGRLLRLPPWVLAIPVVGALIDYRATFAAVVVAYLASGPLLWLRERRTI